MKKIKKNYIWIFLFNIIYIVLTLCIFSSLTKINDYYSILIFLSWYGILTFMISISIYIYLVKEIFVPYVFFYISFFIFTFGQWFLFGVGAEYDYLFQNLFYSQFWNGSELIVIKSLELTIMSLFALNFGAEIYIMKRYNKIKKHKKVIKTQISYLDITGKLLFFISFIPTIYIKLHSLLVSRQLGYLGIYQNSITFPFFPILGKLTVFFIPSLLLMLVANKDNSKYRKIIISICLLYALVDLGIGGRSQAISILMVLILFLSIETKGKISIKKIFLIFSSMYFLLLISSAVAELRGLGNINIGDFIQSIINGNDSIINIIGELGFNLPLLTMITLVPTNVSYVYGVSYYAAFASIIPTFFDFTGIISKMNNIATEQWLTEYTNLDYGIGYSIIAEAYYNFGEFAIIIMFLLGFLFCKFLYLSIHDYESINGFEYYKKLVMFYFISTIPRRGFITFIDGWFYGIIVVSFIMFSLKVIKYKNKNIFKRMDYENK